jgi:hypothetical protein
VGVTELCPCGAEFMSISGLGTLSVCRYVDGVMLSLFQYLV